MNRPHDFVRFGRDDCAGPDILAFGRNPVLIQSRKAEAPPAGQPDKCWLTGPAFLLPFIKAVRNYQTTPLMKGLLENPFGVDRLRPCVDQLAPAGAILSPVGHQSPSNRYKLFDAILEYDRNFLRLCNVVTGSQVAGDLLDSKFVYNVIDQYLPHESATHRSFPPPIQFKIDQPRFYQVDRPLTTDPT